MFKMLGRYQTKRLLDEINNSKFLYAENLKLPLGFILMKLFQPLPQTDYSNTDKETLLTKLYFLRVMLPSNRARIIASNAYANATSIENNTGKNEEYLGHLVVCGLAQTIGQLKRKRSSTANHVFEVNEKTKDFLLYKKFEDLIIKIFEGDEKTSYQANYDYFDSLKPDSPMQFWMN